MVTFVGDQLQDDENQQYHFLQEGLLSCHDSMADYGSSHHSLQRQQDPHLIEKQLHDKQLLQSFLHLAKMDRKRKGSHLGNRCLVDSEAGMLDKGKMTDLDEPN
mmetsp:Transcript_16887/g.31276  ORF Transcript_16887/g.31276 Transcript_16887/m.31276 type:complete len:104 (-) Transcript_16887:488-799(-)